MDEYVSKETLINNIGLIQLHFVAHGENKSLYDIINEQTPADVAPVRHARWGEPYLIFDDIVARDCPVCNYTIGEMKTNYCPNCGAKMDLQD